ncbi:uncharacterized protein LOC106871099 [Octopus bimaculoides]|uniref:DNA helicase Pif1-like 2B domain-containing protein n=1 Tax=Octopus bimaculoides TaxID=37653 RepID=A0A0L8HES0_OCTBM|nr:uncharacterized protein LOC106871099 [Octopus bimaculoides]|eukprot:XP_014772886.1 PREDICTED: uncharacterized protein LOC106871099 [Octopus bimaculoides]
MHFKIGEPVMLLRNIDPPKLCNGTRLIIKKMMPKVLETKDLTGKASDEAIFIPRIPLIPSDMHLQYMRLKFRLKMSFAMSINKAQEQCLDVVGLNFGEPVFSYDQLYVGCSRVGNPNDLFFYAPQGKTKPVVYQALQT